MSTHNPTHAVSTVTTRSAGSHLQVGVLLLLCGLSNELARNLAAGSNEAHNVGMEGQLALQVHLLLEQLQSLRVQPCIQPTCENSVGTEELMSALELGWLLQRACMTTTKSSSG